jgi:hypothetical protein
MAKKIENRLIRREVIRFFSISNNRKEPAAAMRVRSNLRAGNITGFKNVS